MGEADIPVAEALEAPENYRRPFARSLSTNPQQVGEGHERVLCVLCAIAVRHSLRTPFYSLLLHTSSHTGTAALLREYQGI